MDTPCRAIQNNKRNNVLELVLLTAKKKKTNKTKQSNFFFFQSCSKLSGLQIRFTNQTYYAFDWRRAAVITRTVRRVGDSDSLVFVAGF